MKSKKLINNYIYNTFYQVLVLISPLITTPYISRVLGVTNIGIYQYCQSIANYFVLIGAVGTTLYGQREIAYLQDKPKERSKAFWEIEIFRLISTFICVILYLLFFCNHGAYSVIFSILTLEVLATAFDISWLFMGMENFKVTVLRNIIIRLSGIVCTFLLVKKPEDIRIYTLCMTVPLFLGNLSLWLTLNKYLVKTHISLTFLLKGIKERVKPIFLLFLPQIAMDVYLLLDKTMIGIIGSDIDQVGYYSQGQKIVKVVLMLVTSLGTVMMPTMSALFAKGDYEGIKRSLKAAFRFIYMLSFALLFGLCSIASRFVPLFFGEGYEPVTPLIIILSPILVIIATSNVVGRQYLLPTNQQKAFTISILFGAGTNFLLNIILIHFWNAIGASIASVIAELAVTAVQCWYVRKQIAIRAYLRSGLRYLLFGGVMFIACSLIGLILPEGEVWSIIVIVMTGIMVYIAELFFSKDPLLAIGIEKVRSR